MPVKATQPAGYAAGQAQLHVTGARAIDRDTLEVCISGLLDNVEKHLDPRLTSEAWTTTYAWFRPGSPRIEGSALLLDLEPSATWHLRPHTPYVLRLRDAHGLKREERLTWVPIRLPSQTPQGYVPPTGPAPKPASAKPAADLGESSEAQAKQAQAEREAAVAAALAVALEHKDTEAAEQRREEAERVRREQEEHDRAEREALPHGGGPGRGKLLVFAGIAALLLATAAGAWFLKDQHQGIEAPVAAVQPEVPTTLEGAQQFLARDPGADESFGMAEKFRAAKSLEGEFLLLRNAANKGNAPAALALGQMYDPATYSPETSPLPAPNPEQAVEWYRQAAEAGIAEAQYRLGVLLMSGKTDEPNGPEMGVSWLRKAADQGHPQAKDALPK